MDIFGNAGVLGIFCIFAILLVKEILPFITKKNKNENNEFMFRDIQLQLKKIPEIENLIREMSNKVAKTLEMHEKYDQDGRPIWYIKEELEENIKMQKELLHRQNTVLEKIATAIDGQTKLIERMLDRE